jgi:Gas vesicle synthesis protein GvpL/GvpF
VSEPATYVYCLVQSAREPSVKGAPDGMPGSGPARVLAVDRGIWAVVADAPLARFSGDQLQQELQDIEAVSRHALAHASMIEFFFQRSPVIPLKLFTLFSQDDRARRHLAGRGSKVRTMFARLRGLEEWGVRITAANRPVTVRRPGPSGPGAGAPASGRAYLEVKKRMADDDGAPSAATKREVSAVLKALGKLAATSRKEEFPPPGRGRPYVTGASFLVKAKRRAAWKKRVSQLAASLARQDHRLEVSGPWPPYHFATDTRAAR